MALSKQHYVHLENGCFAAAGETSADDLTKSLGTFFSAPSANGISLHFHGGLVSRQRGKEIAERLSPQYLAAETWPLFYIWESGFFEVVKNNLEDIAREEFFKQLFQKIVLWALKRLGGDLLGAKGSALAILDEHRVSHDARAWLEAETPPEGPPPFDEIEGRELLEADAPLDDPEKADQGISHDVSKDGTLRFELQKIANAELPEGTTPLGAKGGTVRGSTATLMTPAGLDKLREETVVPGQKGIFSTAKLALTATRIVFRVIRRMRRGRGHGLYTTAVEEILRDLYLENVGKTFFWNQMKKDTADAFGEDPSLCGGTAFLAGLAKHLNAEVSVPRITLIGHSTGAIYICNLLAAADKLGLPFALKFDVVFLAPAATCKLVDATLSLHGARVRSLRSFGMKDELEKQDRLVWRIYPRSLLYFVSGLLEDEPDMPLVGMQRYYSGQPPYKGSKVPGIDGVKAYLDAQAPRGVWSNTDHGEGRRSSSAKHGDFDNDEATVASLRYILSHGL